MFKLACTIAACCVFAVNCASSGTDHITQSAEERRVVRNNKKEPQWVADQSKPKEGDKYYFVKILNEVYRLDVGVEQAKAMALGSIAQNVGTDIAKMITVATTGDNTIADGIRQTIDDAVSAMSTISISGVEQADLYWEEIKGENGKKNYYNINILVSVPSSEVEKAKKIFMAKFAGNAALESVKGKVEKALQEYRENPPKM